METAFNIGFLGLLALLVVQVALNRGFRVRILSYAARLRDNPPARDISASLPPMVADFAVRSGVDPRRPMRVASYNQTCELRLKQGESFRPFTAWQVVSLGRAGFLWDARQDFGPFIVLRVLDAYVGGEGMLEARLLGSIPVARAAGADIDLAEAYRYLAELPWAPDAILGNPDLEWRVTARNIVEVRLTTQSGVARVSFRFNADGDIVEMEAKDRPARDKNGNSERYDWKGKFGEYQKLGERRVPTYGEVGYIYPSGYEVYFRGHISDYHLAP